MRLFAFVLCLFIGSVQADANEALNSTLRCFSAAGAAELTAKSRDEGTSIAVVASMIQSYYSFGLDATAVEMMVNAVYNAKELTPNDIYSRVLSQCVNLTKPLVVSEEE